MSRSIKKGPFVAPELYKRVEELNKAGEKKVQIGRASCRERV